jgi:hypothetical protein
LQCIYDFIYLNCIYDLVYLFIIELFMILFIPLYSNTYDWSRQSFPFWRVDYGYKKSQRADRNHIEFLNFPKLSSSQVHYEFVQIY